MNRAQRRQAARSNRKSAARPAVAPPGAAVQETDVQREIEAARRLYQAGDPVNAAQAWQLVLSAAPDHPEALHFLGICAADMGQIKTALELIDRSIALGQGVAQFHNNRGNVLNKAGRPEDAVDDFRHAVKIDGAFALAWNNLGVALAAMQKLDEAEDAFRHAVAADASDARAHDNLGNTLYLRGKFDQAEAAFRRAIAADSGYFKAYENLANTLGMQGRDEDAIAAARRAVEIEPSSASAHGTLGTLLQSKGYFAEADFAFRRSLEIDPDSSVTWNNFGNTLKDMGGHAEAIVSFRKALEIDPGHVTAHSNLLFCMGMHAHSSAADIFAESRRWDRAHAAPRAISAPEYGNDRDPDRRLRIGYVSPDFRNHAVSHFVEPLFAAHDRESFELFAYAQVAVSDETSDRIRQSVDGWRQTVGMNYGELAARIRADEIDILIDLAGHTASNRLMSFAERPAPVQATWLGYGGTTGMSAMDYRLTDSIADPEGIADAVHSENLVRL
ncbi:MAG: tetratricopeptide repeat protein, partial [Alphaproteobacteria bacterium]